MQSQAFNNRLSIPFAQLCAFTGQHSPYLRTLIERHAATLRTLKDTPPEDMCTDIYAHLQTITGEGSQDALDKALRLAKADIHLVCALADIGGVWTLDEVTGQLTAFADCAMQVALAGAANELFARGWIEQPTATHPRGPLPGLFVIAMGKYGAGELNYSSDIDFTIFFDPAIAGDWLGKDPARLTSRLVRRLVQSLGAVTVDGYVFRTDMRLRPDPGSTNPVVSTSGAHIYYETVGQNWERAALIKARVCAGDQQAGQAFLSELRPFIWRRSLDFATIEDIHAMKRQIHISLHQSGFETPGHDVKLGRGGIREIEFFTQTQQLILGGRDKTLRSAQTCTALKGLAKAGHIHPDTSTQLIRNYQILRRAEHGAQMLEDQQTHILPNDPKKRGDLAALTGSSGLNDFDAQMQNVFQQVHTVYSALFPQSEPLAVATGSLVFTGVEDDPATVSTLQAKGFGNPHVFLERMRAWHAGQIRATRSDRARTLLTRLGPDLVNALSKTDDADHAFAAFTRFFENLNTGVQPLALLCNRPALLELLVSLLNIAPRLALAFSSRVSILDAMLDPGFAIPLHEDPKAGARRITEYSADASDFEALLDSTRRAALEERLRIGVQILTGKTNANDAARSYSMLASAAIDTLAGACAMQMQDRFGPPPGEWVILGMGSLGAMLMDEGSDLDLITLYRSNDTADATSAPGQYYSRFTRRLISALSAQTPEGALYTIDMKLRPSGKAGPVAVHWPAFVTYYEEKAWNWEILALGRARVVAASSPDFGAAVTEHVAQILARSRDMKTLAVDSALMVHRLRAEYPKAEIWDLKHTPGGLIETELLYQFLQLRERNIETQDANNDYMQTLKASHALQVGLLQVLRLCLSASETTPPFPPPLQALLAEKAGAQDFATLEIMLGKTQCAVAKLSKQILM